MCGCSKPSTPQARARAVPAVESFAVANQPAIGPNEVLVKWRKPTGRNVYRPSSSRQRRQYNQAWRDQFAMLRVDAEGRYKEEVDVAAGV